MKKSFKKAWAIALTSAMIVQPLAMFGVPATEVMAMSSQTTLDELRTIPGPDSDPLGTGNYGATMPYKMYDSGEAQLGGGAAIATSEDFGKMNIATQASKQSYVRLPGSGAYAEWTVSVDENDFGGGDGVTMRFTMPDSGSTGLTGSLDVYVNGSKVQTVNLTSYFMWQYFSSGHPSDSNDGGAPAFAFDEVHFKLPSELKDGDKIRIQSSGANGLEYGVDFLEIERVPEKIKQPANSVNICDYGAVPNDGVDDLPAINSAVAYADANGMDVYFPEGTFHLDSMWRLYASNMKITGAGMWYTNLQFTSDQASGGGIAGGNGYGHDNDDNYDGYCKNIEFCNMYINSNLSSRYNQNAVYKCFMDIWENCIIYNIWEEHFECGFWLGDYNGRTDYSDGVVIRDCRIRNNLADGVNFCQGTSNAAVYNCSIRNNGDDGLAMWNNNHGNAKDESNNIFAYNTIDFIWRAGAIAIYGGTGHKVYNNYIADVFMSSGIHLNTTFPGYAFNNNTSASGITFDNNIIVRSGTSSDCWNEEMGAVDIKGNVKNVTFNNTWIFDAQHEGVRILDNGCSGITFNDTHIYGTGVDTQLANYSSVPHAGAAIRLGGDATFNGLEITNIAYTGENAPYFITGGITPNVTNLKVLPEGTAYVVPGYPTGKGVDPIPPHFVYPSNPTVRIEGADLEVVGLYWENQDGEEALNENDTVSFTVYVKNPTSVNIPAYELNDIEAMVKVGNKSFTTPVYCDGLAANGVIALKAERTWTAEKGGTTFEAVVDYNNNFETETDENNNSKSYNVNVQESNVEKPFNRVTGGYDLIVTDISYNKDTIAVGDQLVWTATVANAGDQEVPAGTVIGCQFQVDGSTAVITWCDTYSGGLQPGETVELTANGGTSGNTWTATEGTHKIMAWVDDTNRLPNEVNESVLYNANVVNNQYTISISVPYGGVQYHESTDSRYNPNGIVIPDPVVITSQPANVTVTEGATASFTVSATGTGLKYQWQSKTASGSWTNISGATSATYSVTTTTSMNNNQYRCVVTDSSNNTATSGAATLTVNAKVVEGNVTITSQPQNVTANDGDTATFTVVATGNVTGYQWQAKAPSGSWKNLASSVQGYNQATLYMGAIEARNGYQYRCVVKGENGNVVTDAVTLTVVSGVTITSQPQNVYIGENGMAVFTVEVTGNVKSYQWQAKAPTGSWKNASSSVAGYNEAIMSISAISARDGYQFRCVVKDQNGKNTITEVATLTINPDAALTITSQPKSVEVTAGTKASFSVAAKGEGLFYLWQYRTSSTAGWNYCASTTEGYNTATITVDAAAANNGYQYRCIIINKDAATLTSNAARLTVK